MNQQGTWGKDSNGQVRSRAPKRRASTAIQQVLCLVTAGEGVWQAGHAGSLKAGGFVRGLELGSKREGVKHGSTDGPEHWKQKFTMHRAESKAGSTRAGARLGAGLCGAGSLGHGHNWGPVGD